MRTEYRLRVKPEAGRADEYWIEAVSQLGAVETAILFAVDAGLELLTLERAEPVPARSGYSFFEIHVPH